MELDYSRLRDHLVVRSLKHNIFLQGQKCCGLVSCDGETLLVWNGAEGRVEAVCVKAALRDGELKRATALEPNPRPFYDVERLVANRSGTGVALVGEESLSVLHLPRDKEWRGRPAPLRREAVTVPLGRRGLGVRQVRWHPGSPRDSHLLVLTADECLRLFDAFSGAPLWTSYLSASDSRLRPAPPPPLSLPSSRSLGDTPVDFAFAPPRLSDDYQESVWPLLVLWGDGDVYSLDTKLKESEGGARLGGPLRVYPTADDNYGTDASSIAVVWSAPPLVLVSTCSGTVHHCLLLGGALLAVERVDLELGVALGEDGGVLCPVALALDPVEKGRYLAVHAAGVHAVTVPLVAELEEWSARGGGEVFPPLETHSDASYVLCTAVSTDFYFCKSPLAGLTHLDGDLYLAVLSDGETLNLRVPSSEKSGEGGGGAVAVGEDPGIVGVVTELLRGAGRPPLLKLPGEATGPREWLELALAVIERYRSRVAGSYARAAAAARLRVSQLAVTLADQTETVAAFLEARAELQSSAEAIAERYEEIDERQTELVARTEALLIKLRGHGGMTARAEKRMSEMLGNFALRSERLDKELKRVQAVVDFNHGSPTSDFRLTLKDKDIYLGESKKRVIRKNLEYLTGEIHALTRRLKEVKSATNSLQNHRTRI